MTPLDHANAKLKELWADPEYRAEAIKKIKKTQAKRSYHRNMRQAVKATWRNAEIRAKRVEGQRLIWTDPDYRAKMIATRRARRPQGEALREKGYWACPPEWRSYYIKLVHRCRVSTKDARAEIDRLMGLPVREWKDIGRQRR